MRKTLVVVVCLLVVDGCSFGMKRLDPKYDGTTEPDCSDSLGAVAGDAVVSGVGIAAALVATQVAKEKNYEVGSGNDAVVLGGAAVGIIFAISAYIGESQYRECKEAKAAWRLGGAINNNRRRAEDREDRAADDRPRDRRRGDKPGELEPLPDDEPASKIPLGFFCASSPSQRAIGVCTREQMDCTRARDALVGAVPDLTECALVETVWCFADGTADRCSLTSETCAGQRGQVVARGAAPGECMARK